MKAYLGQEEVTRANCSPVSTGGTWDACAPPPQNKTKQINVKEEVKSLHIIEENGSWLKRTGCSETDAGAGSGMRKRRAAILRCSFFLIIFYFIWL